MSRDYLEFWFVGVLIALVGLFIWVGVEEERERQVFMRDCLVHEPEYRCTALWRESQPSHRGPR